jgi:cyclopropane-fatty-acyl-phospholipid synthase
MDGLWDCQALDEFFYRLFLSKIPDKMGFSLPLILLYLRAKIFNLQAKSRSFEVGQRHYDLDNQLFSEMLGKSMAYSCGYWSLPAGQAKDLDSAEFAKFDLICRKLNLQKSQKVLDIGCGWGGFAKYAAENYGVSVLGVTVSKEQAEFAKNLCSNLPVEIRLQDYREINEKFDHIVSVGMFEHVGAKNYRIYMETARKNLKENGLFLLHTIGSLTSGNNTDPWLNKYIFPNGSLPSLKQISENVEKLFTIEDVHNFSADYDKTLMEWHKNFEQAWPKFKEKYGERFYRMWNYYLLCCAGVFRARRIQLWQIVLSPNGVLGGYKPVR